MKLTSRPSSQMGSREGGADLQELTLSPYLLIREFTPADHEKLVTMYETFEPKCAFLGLPPHSPTLIRKWLDTLHASGSISIILDAGKRIGGHVMLCSSGRGAAELAIFIHQDFRGRGFGKKMLLGALNYACRRLQLSRVWLDVQASNMIALTLFKKLGFRQNPGANQLRWEHQLARPLSCQPCLGERCEIFGEGVPIAVPVNTERKEHMY